MTVDLLVVNYNTKDCLERLLDVLHSDYVPNVWKLYIQDNDSIDGSKEWLMDRKLDDSYHIEKIYFSENVGYARAINYMAKNSQSKYLAAVNADTWFTTKHVQQMVQSFENNPNQGICGPKQMDEQSRIRHGGIFWDGVNNPTHRGWAMWDQDDSLLKDRAQCWTVSGSLYWVRRNVWDKMTLNPDYQLAAAGAEGAFLPTPHYFEETFCSVHAQHLGFEVWYDGTVDTAGHTWHASAPVGQPSEKFWATSRNMYVRACDMMGMKHEIREERG